MFVRCHTCDRFCDLPQRISRQQHLGDHDRLGTQQRSRYFTCSACSKRISRSTIENSWFGRFEAAGKTAHDLAVVESADAFTVAKLQGGYTRYLRTWRGLKPGVGASLSAGFVPERLKPAYGSRVNTGFGVFLTLRPAAMMMF